MLDWAQKFQVKAGIMGERKPLDRTSGLKFPLKTRIILAIAGILIVLTSFLLLATLNREPRHEFLQISPPATLFVPPSGAFEGDP